MRRIPEAEARTILAQRRECPDCADWEPSKTLIGTFTATSGIVNEDGTRSGLFLELIHYRSQKTRITTYKFSVFQMNPSGPRQVYQLDVRRFPKPPKDEHERAHEHIGDSRHDGDKSWDGWSFDDAIKYFCRQTNIDFIPPVEHPENFKLKP